ncbi:uncharacterized protein LOC133301247 [Gastrolobium bilobum]|uniref:uncharacterized protein LOC133301247 n=1 Tax=Gastrolobium bilobum TaxID=150636 RepID=UPI002AAF92AD|nr:uncharacterized protein LOC133301247 [Gastrolobium bilobum]
MVNQSSSLTLDQVINQPEIQENASSAANQNASNQNVANRSGANRNLTQDFLYPRNPYFLHPNENPSLILVSRTMNDKNYHRWARAMTMALISKNKLSFVNGSISVPKPSDQDYVTWERCNTMVLSWLHRSITDSISQSILWMDRVVDVWKDLKERFSQSDIFWISDLQDEIFCLHQVDKSISDYYTQLKILWDELENLQPTPSCKCIRPCCTIALQVRSIKDRDYSIQFLKGLNEQFSHVRSQIMLMDPLPSINCVFSLVTQKERQMHLEGLVPNSMDGMSKVFFNSSAKHMIARDFAPILEKEDVATTMGVDDQPLDCAHTVGKQVILLIHALRSMDIHLDTR